MMLCGLVVSIVSYEHTAPVFSVEEVLEDEAPGLSKTLVTICIVIVQELHACRAMGI
jgi:hypothetical protein